jgi:hypothetical protein
MKLYEKLRQHAKTTSHSRRPSSETRNANAENPPRSRSRADEPLRTTHIHPPPAEAVSAKQAEATQRSSEVESPAERALSEAAESLKAKIKKCGMDASEFEFTPIRGSYDMNSIAHSLELCLGAIMDKADVPLSNQNAVKVFAKEWGKKSIPFIEKGLDFAGVLFPRQRSA